MQDHLEATEAFLIAAQAASGAWPYYAGNQDAPEPTCYALLALANAERSGHAACVSRGVQALSRSIGADGVVRWQTSSDPHWTASLAILTLTRLRQNEELVDRAASALLSWKVRTARPSPVVPLDSQLAGWSWYDNTFSWIEPTCHALIALKAAGYDSAPRVAEGEALLLDRACDDGGWNYGNPEAFGRRLDSFPDTTALALLALQGTPGAESRVAAGIQFLQQAAFAAPSTLTFAWTILSLNAHGVAVEDYVSPLAERRLADGSWRGGVHLTALATLALQAAEGAPNVFRL